MSSFPIVLWDAVYTLHEELKYDYAVKGLLTNSRAEDLIDVLQSVMRVVPNAMTVASRNEME
jgi:hypothetical protein